MICREADQHGEVCGGVIAIERNGDWLYTECGKCGIVRCRHAQTADPELRQQLRFDQAGLPQRFVDAKFEQTADNQSALFMLKAWVSDVKNGSPLPAPALCGNVGRGKSHLLTMIGVRLIRTCDLRVMFRSARGLLREFQDFENGGQQAWKRATTVDVLILDDLGAERGTEWRQDQLADLVDVRYEAELPIVLATNFPPKAWADVMDARTASRLRGMTFSVELRGPDRRQLAIKEEVS